MKMKDKDWIIARLLYLLSVNDTTVMKFPDVQKTMEFLKDRDIDLKNCFETLNKEYRDNDTFNKCNDTKIHRELINSIKIHYDGISDEDYNELERRFFGSVPENMQRRE